MAHALCLDPVFIGVIYHCDWCGEIEGRLFTDSFTGKELCLACLHKIAYYVTNSPGDEGDNLEEALNEHAADRKEESEDDDDD